MEIAGIEKLVRKGTVVIYYCTTEEDLNALTTTETPTNRNDTNQTTPEADTDIETETNTEPETETNTEPETETNTEPETETNTEPETETNAEPETETNTEPETETNTEPETETNTEPETETNMYLSIREFGNMTAGRFKTTESDTQEILH